MKNKYKIIGNQGIKAIQRVLSTSQTRATKCLSLYEFEYIIKDLIELKKSIIKNNDFEK